MTVQEQQRKISNILQLARAARIPDFEGLQLRFSQNMEERDRTNATRQKEVNDNILIIVRSWASVKGEIELTEACDKFTKSKH